MKMSLALDKAFLVKSDGVDAVIRQGGRGKSSKKSGKSSVTLDFCFNGAGHAIVRVPVSLVLPANYVLTFEVSGACPVNTLELKFLDQSTDNVWWLPRPNFNFPVKPTRLTNKRRQISYAWGPNKEPMREVAFIDFTVTASSLGFESAPESQSDTSVESGKSRQNKGSVTFSKVEFEELPVQDDPAKLPPPVVRATSGRKSAANVLDGDDYTLWKSSKAERQSLIFDFAAPRELSCLILDWGGNFARNYQVQVKGTRGGWQNQGNLNTIIGAEGGRQWLRLPDIDIKSIRLVMRRSAGGPASSTGGGLGYELRSVRFMPLDWAPDANSLWRHIAADYPKGFFPRYFQNKQSFWTVVGVSGGKHEAIINEEGMLEVGRQTISIDPFVFSDKRCLLTWARSQGHTQSLRDGYLPIPKVTRHHKEEDVDVDLSVETFAVGEQKSSTLYARYTVTNTGKRRETGKLFLALRQFQVNPPWQFLNTPGGFTPVHGMNHAGDTVYVSDKDCQSNADALRIVSLTKADAFGATTLASGDVTEHLNYGLIPEAGGLCDLRGFGSGVLSYDYDLAPGQSKSVDIAVPYTPQSHLDDLDNALAQAVSDWQALSQVGIDLPAYPELVDTMRSQLAYILINRDERAIQPGSRCYRRTWIRDGALTSAALLQNGFAKEVRDFIEWFAPFQYGNGKVPCCVDKRGSDPTPEHDSHGEFIYLVMEYYRFTRDRDFLAAMYPRLVKAAGYIDELRSQCLTEKFRQPEHAHLYGILPPSISHEGYSAHPAHSNWDNLFAMKGLDDVVSAAEILQAKELGELTALRDAFHGDFIASIKNSMAVHKIGYIPGAADLGDLDPTSTTIGLDPANRLAELPDELRATFERYWQFFCERRDGSLKWDAYTPYEWRTVGAMVRIGEVERAHQALAYFMGHRRPLKWNHWAEVIYSDPLTPRFVGDAPHGWVGSDFLRSVRNLFVYEEADHLVLAAGIKPEWLEQGFSVRDLPTHFGKISFSGKRQGDVVSFDITTGGAEEIPLKLSLYGLCSGAGRALRLVVNGEDVTFSEGDSFVNVS